MPLCRVGVRMGAHLDFLFTGSKNIIQSRVVGAVMQHPDPLSGEGSLSSALSSQLLDLDLFRDSPSC